MNTILPKRDALAEVLRFEYEGRTVSGAEFERLFAIVADALPPKVDPTALADSLRHVAGVVLTPRLILDTCHRLLGNLARLQSGRVVSPWHCQRFPEWVPAQVMAVRRERGAGRKQGVGAGMLFKIMAGTPAALFVHQWWSMRRCQTLARDAGFSRSSRRGRTVARFPYEAPEQYVRLRFYGLVDPERSESEPYISDVVFPDFADIRGWNRQVMMRRAREDPYGCIAGMPDSFPCHKCPVGSRRCPAATHERDFEERACKTCGRSEAVWDTELSGSMCAACYAFTLYNPNRKPPRADPEGQ